MEETRKKRPYPRRVNDEDKRIVVSFSLSADTLKQFREALSIEDRHEPDKAAIRAKAIDLAHQAIAAYIGQRISSIGEL